MDDERKILIAQALRETEIHVPEGQYEAWANPDIRIPREEVFELWKTEIETIMNQDTSLEESDERQKLIEECTVAIRAALFELEGPREYFSLTGYSDFEKRLFNKKYLDSFISRFPSIAPYLENLRKKMHSVIRLNFQPEIIEALKAYLVLASYPEWSPNSLKRSSAKPTQAIHTWIRNHVQGLDGKPDWSLVLERLPQEMADKFSKEKAGRPIPEEEMFNLLTETLDEIIAQKGYWTPQEVQMEWKSLYEKLRKKFRTPAGRPDIQKGEDADRPNWHEILKNLPDKYREKFRWAFGKEMKYRTEAEAVKEIKDILTQWQPERWGPGWLEENGFWAIRQYWENHYRLPNGKIDWKRLLDQLPDNLKEGFTR